MKNLTFIAVALACALVTGCRNPKDRVSVLPDASVTGRSKAADLNTNPLADGAGAKENGVTGVSLANPNLPDDNNLADRETDRSVFKDQTVYFEFDQAHVKVGEASKVEQVVGAFKAKPTGFDLLIEGHCDERGTEEYNRSLGERRALALRELLMKSGIDGQHIYTRTFGKDQPAVVGHDEAAWGKNRRGEFILVLPKKIITTQNSQ
jgi:outer membrane protein OmpA-like peptidoglycan-associated protein